MPTDGFLDVIRRERPDALGDGKTNPAGQPPTSRPTGTGPPTGAPGTFLFATGIECSYPTIGNGTVRRDLLAECGHYDRYQQDLRLVRDLGLRVLRYGLPYYRTHLGPGRYDWDFADRALEQVHGLGIEPILDLLHFGVPDWLGDFQNPQLPVRFAEYCAAVAQRYPWVRFYTPVNEIYVAARMSALDGAWNEQRRDPRSFVRAIVNLCAASVLGSKAIAEHRPDAVFVQSETAEFTHDARARPDRALTLRNALRFVSLDLLYAHPLDGAVLTYFYDNGLTRDEYAWFMAGDPPGYQVMGNDYYGRNERIQLPDGSELAAEDIAGWYGLTKLYWGRYYKPVMHTETNVDDPALAPTWLWKQFINILRMRDDGVPVIGFTWYSLTDQVDWDVGLRQKRGKVNAVGLYDLDRRPRPVAAAYRALLAEFGQLPMVPRGGMFQLADRPAGAQLSR